ncbi:hypothetical protein [Burkholderia phage FLC6]|nr:hypothetical protein [Burkholderia phage FLC6]
MNTIRSSALLSFGNIREAYYKERDAGKTIREATLAVMQAFPEIPVVEIATAMFMIENDYGRRKLNDLNATQAALYRTVNQSEPLRLATVH